MTPKEKAEELYKKMYTQHPNIYPSTAKQCALIAVDEVLNFIHTDAFSYTNEEYWQEVKNELNK
jgi:predicted metal-dependent hydrolase